jgi:hypothetical protein
LSCGQQDLSITANKITNETDSVATHQLYRKWGKKWVDSWEDCKKFGPVKWSCKTRYADRTKSWTDFALIKEPIKGGVHIIICVKTSLFGLLANLFL